MWLMSRIAIPVVIDCRVKQTYCSDPNVVEVMYYFVWLWTASSSIEITQQQNLQWSQHNTELGQGNGGISVG
jgi:hypothetical protein